MALAAVIGTIMISAGAMAYNEAKKAAGNSRAHAKVVSLQQMVEELAVQSADRYPTIEPVRAAWKRRRPHDYRKSPWDGQVGTDLNDPDDNGMRGVADNSTSQGHGGPSPGAAGTSKASPWRGDLTNSLDDPGSAATVAGINMSPPGSVPLVDSPKGGGLSYSLNDVGGSLSAAASSEQQNNTETEPVWDLISNNSKFLRGYAVWVYDSQGQYPAYVAGGATPGDDK